MKGYNRMEREQLNVLWDGMKHTLNQMQRSQYATTQSKAYGYGGAVVVHQITGLALNTITRGKKELLYPVESKPRGGYGKSAAGRNGQKRTILIFENTYGL
jgi:hypothetical protein